MRISDWSSDVCSSDLELPEKPVPLDKARKEKRLCRRIEVAHRMRIEGCHQQEPTLAARKGRRVAHDSLVADVKTVEIPKRQDGAAHRWCERELRQHVSPLPYPDSSCSAWLHCWWA